MNLNLSILGGLISESDFRINVFLRIIDAEPENNKCKSVMEKA